MGREGLLSIEIDSGDDSGPPPDPDRDDAIAAIEQHLADVGSGDWSALRERFADVPKATWW
jgi:hypothetical protein